ncbi:Probable protein phosphatase 2C 62 (OsPP2C62) [Durusdinium trenchii]|uniref:Probable protein phosphatase 2C 62 (OsPP2C62) n=1 Tax=Durusdinium trenchii TaxID=1381693 RepID=A0ABP0SD29_9DINO
MSGPLPVGRVTQPRVIPPPVLGPNGYGPHRVPELNLGTTQNEGRHPYPSRDLRAPQVTRETANSNWPEAPPIAHGPYVGVPRGAGIIAFREDRVCLVQSRNGKLSFPKGGKKRSDRNVLDCAYRELLEETSIQRDRVMLHEGLHLDEEKFGCRYLLAEVVAKDGDLDFNAASWTPRHEDPTDKDPVVQAHWAPVGEVLAGAWGGLHPGRARGLRSGPDPAQLPRRPRSALLLALRSALRLALRALLLALRSALLLALRSALRLALRALLLAALLLALRSALLLALRSALRSALGEQPMQLQYSRAFGAKDLKIFGLSSVPDVKIIRMDSGAVKNVRFLVLASDGLWDVMSAQEAARQLQEAIAHRQHPAECLVQAALNTQGRLGGRADNITAVTVQFD